jgi:hypothetical protein
MNTIVIGFIFANIVALSFLIYSILNFHNMSKDRRISRKCHDYSIFSMIFAIVLFFIIVYATYRVYDLANSIKKTGEFIKTTLTKTTSELLRGK